MKYLEKLIGDIIVSRRKAAGLTQKDLARIAKISPITMNRIEKGKQNPQGPNLDAIASALGCSSEELIKDISEKSNSTDPLSAEGVIEFIKSLEARTKKTTGDLQAVLDREEQLRAAIATLQTQLVAHRSSNFQLDEEEITYVRHRRKAGILWRAFSDAILTRAPAEIALLKQAVRGRKDVNRMLSTMKEFEKFLRQLQP